MLRRKTLPLLGMAERSEPELILSQLGSGMESMPIEKLSLPRSLLIRFTPQLPNCKNRSLPRTSYLFDPKGCLQTEPALPAVGRYAVHLVGEWT
jgi:hypothetical protein